jgi:hypothetical protein
MLRPGFCLQAVPALSHLDRCLAASRFDQLWHASLATMLTAHILWAFQIIGF